MTGNENVPNNPAEKKKERVFVLGIGKGPKMRTIELVFTPVEDNKDAGGSGPVKHEEEKQDKLKDETGQEQENYRSDK